MTRPPSDSSRSRLLRRLRRLRRRRLAVEAAFALTTAATLAVGLGAGVVLVEAALYLPPSWRLVLLGVILLSSICLPGFRLWWRVRDGLPLHRVALDVERRAPELSQRLVTALELGIHDDGIRRFHSAQLLEATTVEAAHMLAGLETARVVPVDDLRSGAARLAGIAVVTLLVGLAAGGYDVGMVMGNFEWMAVFFIIILGLVFAPFYFRSKISTLPEFLERRYSPGSRTALAFIAVIAALLIHIGISLYAGAVVFQSFFGIEPFYSMMIIAGVTTVYTVLGGLKAVVVTEAVQAVILLGGAVLVSLRTQRAQVRVPSHAHELSYRHREGLGLTLRNGSDLPGQLASVPHAHLAPRNPGRSLDGPQYSHENSHEGRLARTVGT